MSICNLHRRQRRHADTLEQVRQSILLVKGPLVNLLFTPANSTSNRHLIMCFYEIVEYQFVLSSHLWRTVPYIQG